MNAPGAALLIDAGHSRLKWALWERRLHGLSAAAYDPTRPREGFEQAWSRLREPPRAIHACNVAGAEVAAALRDWCGQRWRQPVAFAQTQRRAGRLVNGYRDPGQLGVDRWLAMRAAWDLCGGSLCVVDCGTAVTVDVVDAGGRHRGGLILPGPDTARAALLQRLPHLSDPGRPAPGAGLGNNTRDAAGYGLYYMVFGALARIAEYVRDRYGGGTRFYVCGGAAALATRHLGRECRQVPDLVLKGLANYFSLT